MIKNSDFFKWVPVKSLSLSSGRLEPPSQPHRIFIVPTLPIRIGHTVDAQVGPIPQGPLLGEGGSGLSCHGTIMIDHECVQRTLTKRSLASGDEAEGRQDTVREGRWEVGGMDGEGDKGCYWSVSVSVEGE